MITNTYSNDLKNMDLPPINGTGETMETPAGELTSSGGTINVAPAVNFAVSQTPFGNLPGINSTVGAMTGNIDAADFLDSLYAEVTGWGAAELVGHLAPGVPALPGIVAGLATEGFKDNPNYSAKLTQSTIGAGATVLGGAIAGPPGALIAGTLADYVTKASLDDGWLGDITDARSREKERDAVEGEWGFSREDTSSMAKTQGLMDAFGVKDNGFGLDAAYSSTAYGQMEAAGQKSFQTTSLADYLDRMKVEIDDMMRSDPAGGQKGKQEDDSLDGIGRLDGVKDSYGGMTAGRIDAKEHSPDEGSGGVGSGEAGVSSPGDLGDDDSDNF